MEKFATYGVPVLSVSGVALYWTARMAVILAAVALWFVMLTAWLLLVWFIKGAPPRLVMRYF